MTESDPQVSPQARVFVSHSTEDRHVAEEISSALKAADFAVWFDAWELQAGDSIATRVREGLSSSDFLIVLLSPDSVASQWVRDEIMMALSGELRQRAITVVPVLLRDCDVPPALGELITIDLREDNAGGIARLVGSLQLARDVDFALLSPRQFEEMVVDIFRAEGFSVQASMGTRDGGQDLFLTKNPTLSGGIGEPSVYAVQVKHYKERRVSIETIRSVLGSIVLAGKQVKGIIVSSTQLTSAARELVADVNRTSGLELDVIDGPDLERTVLRHPDVVNRYFRRGAAK